VIARKAAVLAALLLAGAPSGAEPPAPAAAAAPAGRYNLILISLGNVGAAHMSLYGYARPTTPRLDRWSRDAVVFENAYSPASWTLPVGTSLFTGLYPDAHGVTARGQDNALNPAVPTLPEILRRDGYATAAFTGGLDYAKGFGHMRGFETVADNPDFSGYGTTLPQASRWLAGHEDGRFFLFVHGYDAHCPFVPPAAPIRGTFTREHPAGGLDTSRCLRGVGETSEGWVVEANSRCELDKTTLQCKNAWTPERHILKPADVAHLRDLYDEDVLSVDSQVGGFLESLSTATLARTIVVVYCEHGEMFAKHGRFGRPGAVVGAFDDDVIHVPLLIRLPSPLAERLRGMVSLVDLMPTLLDLLGEPAPKTPEQGVDLRPLIDGTTAQVHERLFSGSAFRFSRSRAYPYPLHSSAVRDSEWKLVSQDVVPDGFARLPDAEFEEVLRTRRAPKPRTTESLYRVSRDPAESVDLARQRPGVAARLRSDLRRWREECAALLSARPPETKSMPDSLLRSARERGYW
jgi:arylsulfatase A-like enzyme